MHIHSSEYGILCMCICVCCAFFLLSFSSISSLLSLFLSLSRRRGPLWLTLDLPGYLICMQIDIHLCDCIFNILCACTHISAIYSRRAQFIDELTHSHIKQKRKEVSLKEKKSNTPPFIIHWKRFISVRRYSIGFASIHSFGVDRYVCWVSLLFVRVFLLLCVVAVIVLQYVKQERRYSAICVWIAIVDVRCVLLYGQQSVYGPCYCVCYKVTKLTWHTIVKPFKAINLIAASFVLFASEHWFLV